MADSKRGGRSNDDEFDENDVVDSSADLEADDVDFEADDDESSDDKALAGAKSGKARSTSRTVSKDKRDEKSVGIVGRIVRFIREVVAELQKVIYPTRKELLTYTSVVLVFVIVVMTVVSLLDLGFAKLMFLVFGDQTTT